MTPTPLKVADDANNFAALVASISKGMDIQDAGRIAASAAGAVVAELSTAPLIPASLWT